MNILEDFKQLLLKAPKHYCPRQDNVNCEYGSFIYRCKNCYMAFASDYLEDSFYTRWSKNSKDCGDCHGVWNSELAYECVDTQQLYNCDFCQDTWESRDCFLCEYCGGCKDCFGCSGLRHAQYYIFNKKVRKEEYEMRLPELKKRFFEDRECIMVEFEKIRYDMPRSLLNLRCGDDFYGSYSMNCKNGYEVHDSANAEDCMYLYLDTDNVKDCVDCLAIKDNCELLYDCMSCAASYNCNHSFWVITSSDCEYCYCVNSCKNCFMCTNLKHKKLHILNEPYQEEEYFRRVAEIKNELKVAGLGSENLLALVMEA